MRRNLRYTSDWGWRGRGKSERAFALPFAALVVLVITVIGIAFIEMGRMDSVASVRDVHGSQALAAAELGLERAVAMSQDRNIGWDAMTYNGSPLSFSVNGDPAMVAVYGDNETCVLPFEDSSTAVDEATYEVVVEKLGSHVFRVHGIGNAGMSTHRVTLDSVAATPADGFYTNQQGSNFFNTGDTIIGKFHTNGMLNIKGTPTWMGPVHTAAGSLNLGSGAAPDFQSGISFNYPVIDIGAILGGQPIEVVRLAALSGGIYLPPNDGQPYQIKFQTGGKISVKKYNESGSEVVVLDSKSLSSTNGAIYVEEDVEVLGQVGGQVTVATAPGKDIIIMSDLVYDYPSNYHSVFDDGFDYTDPQFVDKLGLVSGGDIVIDEDAADNLHVMGSLVALEGTFRNEAYATKNGSTLYLYGALAEDTHGLLGLGDLGQAPTKGYIKHYIFDSRFSAEPPPYYLTYGYYYSRWRLTE